VRREFVKVEERAGDWICHGTRILFFNINLSRFGARNDPNRIFTNGTAIKGVCVGLGMEVVTHTDIFVVCPGHNRNEQTMADFLLVRAECN
jgi:hypothetical protein